MAHDFVLLAEAEDFSATFVRMVRKHFLEEPREKAVLCLAIWSEATRNPDFASLSRDFDCDVLTRLTGLIERAKERGKVSASVEPQSVALLIATLANGLFVRRAVAPDFHPEREIGQMLAVIEAAFAGRFDLPRFDPVETRVRARRAAREAPSLTPRATPAAFGVDVALGLAVAFGLSLAITPGTAGAGQSASPAVERGSSVAVAEPPRTAAAPLLTPVVTVARAVEREIVERAIVTGTLVPREEILVAAEVEGLRIVEVLAEEGDVVKQGQVLARLSRDLLEAQLAQNAASLARSEAAIAQARSTILQAEAANVEAQQGLERARALQRTRQHHGSRARAAGRARPRRGGAARRRPGWPAHRRGRSRRAGGDAPRDRGAPEPHRDQGAGRRHRQPQDRPDRRDGVVRRRSAVPHDQGRGDRARRRGARRPR